MFQLILIEFMKMIAGWESWDVSCMSDLSIYANLLQHVCTNTVTTTEELKSPISTWGIGGAETNEDRMESDGFMPQWYFPVLWWLADMKYCIFPMYWKAVLSRRPIFIRGKHCQRVFSRLCEHYKRMRAWGRYGATILSPAPTFPCVR